MNHQSKLVKYFIAYFNENFNSYRFPFKRVILFYVMMWDIKD